MTWTDVLRTAFDTPPEVHAFVHGLYQGVKTPHPKPECPDSVNERAYFQAGVLAGDAVQVAVVLGALYVGIDPPFLAL